MSMQLDTTSSLPIHHGERIFSKLLSRETSAVCSSRAMYYGGVQSSIPFGWESQPGTPKNPGSETNPNDIILTLTPPPSLYCSSSSSSMSSSSSSGSPKSHRTTKLLKNGKGSYYLSPNCIASRLKGNPRRAQTGSPSSSSSSLSSLSPSSSWSGPVLSSSSPKSENVDRSKSMDSEFSISTPKFVGSRKRAMGNKLKGCFEATTLKRAVLAIVGLRSGNRST